MVRYLVVGALILVSCAPSSTADATPTATVRLATATSRSSPTARATPFPSGAPYRYVALGASDTVGVGASDPATKSWPAVLRTKLPAGTAYLNLGVSGSTVAQAIVEQLPDAMAHDADVVTIWLAFNDLARGVDVLAYQNDLARLLDALTKANRAKIFVADLPDLTLVPATSGADPAALASRVAAYNAAIREVIAARAPRVVLVDLFEGSDVIGQELVVSSDGLHPNDRGYALIAGRFALVMKQAGVPVT